jgi:hypothetical protein
LLLGEEGVTGGEMEKGGRTNGTSNGKNSSSEDVGVLGGKSELCELGLEWELLMDEVGDPDACG